MSHTSNSEDRLRRPSILLNEHINDQPEQPVACGNPYNAGYGSPSGDAQHTHDTRHRFESESAGRSGRARMSSNIRIRNRHYQDDVSSTSSSSDRLTNQHSRQLSSNSIEGSEREDNGNNEGTAMENPTTWDNPRPSRNNESYESLSLMPTRDRSLGQSVDLQPGSSSRQITASVSIDKGKAPIILGHTDQTNENINIGPFESLHNNRGRPQRHDMRRYGSSLQETYSSNSYYEREPALSPPGRAFPAYVEDTESEDFARGRHQRRTRVSRRSFSGAEYESLKSSETRPSSSEKNMAQRTSYDRENRYIRKNHSPIRSRLAKPLRRERDENEESGSEAVYSSESRSENEYPRSRSYSDFERIGDKRRLSIRSRSPRYKPPHAQSPSEYRNRYPPAPSPPYSYPVQNLEDPLIMDYDWRSDNSSRSSPEPAFETYSRRSSSYASPLPNSIPSPTRRSRYYGHNGRYTTHDAYSHRPSNAYLRNHYPTNHYPPSSHHTPNNYYPHQFSSPPRPPPTNLEVTLHGNQQERDAAEPQSFSATIINPALSYKAPVDFDNSTKEISLHIALEDMPQEILKSSISKDKWSQDTINRLLRTGTCQLSTALALEHYADGLGHDKITLINPNPLDTNTLADESTHLKWLHLKQSTLCLNDLAELVGNCQFLDSDYKLLALQLLRVECAKLERSSNGHHYLEPGTAFRCDGTYDDLSRGERSVLFCSAPYLNLEKQYDVEKKLDQEDVRIHHTRTLLESLYDHDLVEERDNKQVIRQTDPELQDIICVPQVWYLLCGSPKLR
ncbi:hypothetical protein F5B20DRAFT_553814 [Whalleya microplaca]|nr:hypothetical protein F5B20DRAFT_553814 [Whalleya microplaca]